MMYYSQAPVQQHGQMFVAAEQYSQRFPMAPVAVGTAPTSYSSMPYQQLYNPTIAPGAMQLSHSGAYYPQPAAMQPVSVKRHNPYAPISAPSTPMTSDRSAFDSSSATAAYQMSVDYNSYGDMHDLPVAGKYASGQHQVTSEELMGHRGTLVELSRTAPGSSFVQAALRDGTPFTQQNVAMIAAELLPAASTLLLDAHGCYVVKTLMERLPTDQLKQFVRTITEDQHLVYSMCTHSLHTRRVVQFLMDSVDVVPVAEVLIQRCAEVSMTQQGCIIMQRAMDITQEPLKAQLFSTIFDNLVEFAVDPFANYVVQHMLEIGDKELCSSAVLRAFRGNIVKLACNKFASNVLEKSLFHINPDAQHDLLHEMYDADEEVLHSMMQDSFGNYLIQSSIALATFKDVVYINDRLKSVLQRTPYGHKIELRIERRLKGRPVGTRSSQIGANSKSSRQQRVSSRDPMASEPVEEPW